MRIAIAIALGLIFLAAPAFAQTVWTRCAGEGGSCTISAPKLARYGQHWQPAGVGTWTTPRTIAAGTFSCTNAYFGGDPSPGTGKECEIMDAAAPPATGMLPPLTSGETYVVTWTPPTKNTDGTPIKPITLTQIHAGTEPTFATYYSWDTAIPTAASFTVSNGPTGTVYWRMRVTTADGTSDWTASAITERAWVAQTKPPCWPKPFGSGSWIKASQNTSGFALYWQCQTPAGWKHTGFMGLWTNLDPDWTTQLATAMAGGDSAFNTLWDTKITGPSQTASYAAVRPLWEALRDANPLPAAPTSKVAINGTATTRPSYAVVAGSRTSATVGRVAVGAPCDCAAFQSAPYCAVTGQPNVATADPADRLPASAAVCSN